MSVARTDLGGVPPRPTASARNPGRFRMKTRPRVSGETRRHSELPSHSRAGSSVARSGISHPSGPRGCDVGSKRYWRPRLTPFLKDTSPPDFIKVVAPLDKMHGSDLTGRL